MKILKGQKIYKNNNNNEKNKRQRTMGQTVPDKLSFNPTHRNPTRSHCTTLMFLKWSFGKKKKSSVRGSNGLWKKACCCQESSFSRCSSLPGKNKKHPLLSLEFSVFSCIFTSKYPCNLCIWGRDQMGLTVLNFKCLWKWVHKDFELMMVIFCVCL